MNNLHGITVGNLERWLWAVGKGGNNNILGQPRENRWNPVYHAYLIPRGAPPPIVGELLPHVRENNMWRRRHWNPFSFTENPPNDNFILNPACGRIRTQSRFPHLSLGRRNWNNPRVCEDCRALHPDTIFYDEAGAQDPWQGIERDARPHTIDPISGQ